jgi:hypothetical protein
MYVLVDRGLMAITHKHRDRAVLANLAWIECTNNAATVPLGNVKLWAEFTPLELKKIYKNATGADLQGYGTALAQAVSDMAKRLPESVVNAEEVAAQRLCVMDGDRSCYQYAPGAMVPAQHVGLFEPDPLKCERVEAEELRAASSRPAYNVPAPSAGGGTGPASTAASTSGAPAAPAAPRPGGSRETIFRVADEMWQAAGSPSDVKRVLELRKQIMIVLETEHSIKKTTSSTALGDWQKTRLS